MTKKDLNKNIPSYNFHTHTNRCGHASLAEDSLYVDYAIKTHIDLLGFSDHVPFTSYEFPNPWSRMFNDEIEDYINDVKTLQKQYENITILCGFEVEYDELKDGYLKELRNRVDYFVLGQHFVNDKLRSIKRKNNPDYPIEYAKVVCKALDTGLFDMVAHPDIFMQYRDSLETEELRQKFLENSKIASLMICNKAKELDIPLEINFARVGSDRYLSDGELIYPHSLFWKVASLVKCPVMYGIDAHSPKQILLREESQKYINSVIDVSKLNFVAPNYNPVEARKNNKKLGELLNKNADAKPYELCLVNVVIDDIFSKIPNNTDSVLITNMIKDMYDFLMNSLIHGQSMQDEKIMDAIKELKQNKSLTSYEREFKEKRFLIALNETRLTIELLKDLVKKIKDSSFEVSSNEHLTKEEYYCSIMKLVEEKILNDKDKASKQTLKKITG